MIPLEPLPMTPGLVEPAGPIAVPAVAPAAVAPASPKARGATKTKRTPTMRSYAIVAGATVELILERGIASFSITVVDATTFAAVAWTLGFEADPSNVRHFSATALPYVEEWLGPRFGPVRLTIGAAVAARVELIAWKA